MESRTCRCGGDSSRPDVLEPLLQLCVRRPIYDRAIVKTTTSVQDAQTVRPTGLHQSSVPLITTQRPRDAVSSTAGGVGWLLDEDPELTRGTPDALRRRLRRAATVELRVLGRGTWRAEAEPSLGTVLVLDGMLCREVCAGIRRSAELIGEGDVLAPAAGDSAGGSCDGVLRWRVLTPARLAILDPDLLALLARIPGVIDQIVGRTELRSRRLGFLLAVAQEPVLGERLKQVLWHLTDRWGRVGVGGTRLTLPFGQQTLADIAAARRTSINDALRRLERDGVLERLAPMDLVLRPERVQR